MTRKEVIIHWRKGAKDAMAMAILALKAGKYEHVFFNCQLAAEKALKAADMSQHKKEAPYVHDLGFLANRIVHNIPETDLEFLQELSDFAVDARYNDPAWAHKWATRDHARKILKQTGKLLPLIGL